MTKEDKRTGRQTGREGGWGKGEQRGGNVSSRRVSSCYPAVIRRGVPFVLASKTGGRGRGVIFFFVKRTNCCVGQCSWLREVGVSLKGNELVNCAPDGPKWTALNITECRREG